MAFRVVEKKRTNLGRPIGWIYFAIYLTFIVVRIGPVEKASIHPYRLSRVGDLKVRIGRLRGDRFCGSLIGAPVGPERGKCLQQSLPLAASVDFVERHLRKAQVG